ncbi:MAG: FAD-binding oxidoreductase [Cyanobacteriota bacterium]|nr:FAD-binding oxidoreductase [Cyanobacteriota bacterium]
MFWNLKPSLIIGYWHPLPHFPTSPLPISPLPPAPIMNAIASPPYSQTEIAAALDFSNSDVTVWDDLSGEWQEKLQRTIAASTPPVCLVSPRTENRLAEVIEACHRHTWPVLACGNGSKLSWGGLIPEAIAIAVSTQNLNRILEHAIGDLTVTVEAGVKLADLQTILAQTGQFLPLVSAYSQSSTIGGIVATGDSWRQRYGGVRDVVLGLSFARADGQIAKAGGRVVKNVAGYDLMKLFAGSYGTLGVITQVTLRTYPIPSASETIAVVGEPEGIEACDRALIASNLAPMRADLLSGAVVGELGLGEGMAAIARFGSMAESVREQTTQVAAIAQKLGLTTHLYRERDEIQLWNRLKQLVENPNSSDAIVCKIGITPTAAIPFLNNLDSITQKTGLGVIHCGVGLGRLYLTPDSKFPSIQKLRTFCQENRGFLTLLEAPASLKTQLEPWGYTGNALELMGKIKHQFDPKTILSPNRFVGKL